MGSEWEEMQLGEALIINPRVTLTRGEEYVFVEMKDIDENQRVVTSDTKREYKGGGSKFMVGDTLLARITPCLENGKIAQYISENLLTHAHGSTEFIVIRGRQGVTDSDFAFYLTTSPFVRDYAISQMTGSSGRQRVPTLALEELLVEIPPLPTQRRIAKILGDLDDKIELNRKMNQTLEAMARALFKSWFVDFDPVKAKMEGRLPTGMDQTTAALFPDSFQDSEHRMIPKGWEAAHLIDVVEVFDSKRVPLSGREREQRKGPYPYHGAASAMDYVDDFIFDGIYVLMGEDGSVINADGTPVMQYVWGKFWVNNHAHVLRGKNGICTEHLLLHLKSSNIVAFVTGAVQLKLNQGNMNRIPFMLPPPGTSEAFAQTIEPLFAQIRANTDQSRALTTLRDSLLPKLMSGEVQTKVST